MAGLLCKSFKVTQSPWAPSLPAEPSEVHVRSLICESVCLHAVCSPGGVRLQWTFKSLMSKRCVKSPIVVKVSCVFSHWWEERTNTKEGWRWGWKEWGMKDTSCTSSWKEEGGSDCYYFFTPVILSFFGPCKELLGSICGRVPPQLLQSSVFLIFLTSCDHKPIKPREIYLWCTHTHTHFHVLIQVVFTLNLWENETLKYFIFCHAKGRSTWNILPQVCSPCRLFPEVKLFLQCWMI